MSGRVEICGGIASGKSALARLFEGIPGVTVVYEDFRRNPFWERFHQAPAMFFREKNICFLAQHCGELRPYNAPQAVVADYAVFQDIVYAAMANDASHTLLMSRIYRSLYNALPRPKILVQLRCPEEILLERIRRRARPQEQSISIGYLRSLNEVLASSFDRLAPRCARIILDSNLVNFADDEGQALKTKEAILAKLRADPDSVERTKLPHGTPRVSKRGLG